MFLVQCTIGVAIIVAEEPTFVLGSTHIVTGAQGLDQRNRVITRAETNCMTPTAIVVIE